MSTFNQDRIAKLTKLCRIQCSEEEQQSLMDDLNNILAYAALLNEVNTENVQPLTHVIDYPSVHMRDDVEEGVLPREKFLKNAPDQLGGLVRFPPVLKSN